MNIHRCLGHRIQAACDHFPAVLLTGARQTGKTTLVRELFPEKTFVTLDLPSIAEEAETRPGELLKKHPPPVIIDEVQYAPGIFRYLKTAIDADRRSPGRYLLTGSQKFQLMEAVSESLAGRCAILELHTLSAREYERGDRQTDEDWLAFLHRGGYPELTVDPSIPLGDYFRSYVATYLERDVRNLLEVGSLRDFERLLRLAAARSTSLLNMTDLARDVGVAVSTIRQWVSVLEASGVVRLLEPYFNNLGKRLVKTPKLYFLDTGLLCFLLGISSARLLLESPFLGMVWETFVLGQIIRDIEAMAPAATVWFWRDAHGLEADFLIDIGSSFELIECKWTEAPQRRDLVALGKVAAHLRSARPVRSRLACRTPQPHMLGEQIEATDGFRERAWLPAEAVDASGTDPDE